jgi:hypothetical protein
MTKKSKPANTTTVVMTANNSTRENPKRRAFASKRELSKT